MFKNLRVGFAFTASFCTFEKTVPALEELKEKGAQITPIFSKAAYNTDTRFGTAAFWREQVEQITGSSILYTEAEVEPIGPRALLDILIVAPCTGNTLGKLANGISDSSVSLSVKAHLRNNRPVLLGISTNDGLGNNAINIGKLLNSKNIYFVPFGQDDPFNKSNSLVAHMDMICQATEAALKGQQIQPLITSYDLR